MTKNNIDQELLLSDDESSDSSSESQWESEHSNDSESSSNSNSRSSSSEDSEYEEGYNLFPTSDGVDYLTHSEDTAHPYEPSQATIDMMESLGDC